MACTIRLVEWMVLGSKGRPACSSLQDTMVPQQQQQQQQHPTTMTMTPRPRGLRLVLMGDSLLRYSYLSLVYFLKWGTWYDPDMMTPHLVQASTFTNLFHNQTWAEHAWQTNRMLLPFEICDCYRKLPGALQVNKVVNNRYYYDPTYDNSVVYLDAKGHKGSLHGRILAQNVSALLHEQLVAFHNGPVTTQQQPSLPSMTVLQRPYAWNYVSWSDTIREYVAYLDPTPTHVVMNAGLWPNHFLDQPQLANDIIQELNKIRMSSPNNNKCHGIWKTTSHGKGGSIAYPTIPPTDTLMCDKLQYCWNQSWTQHIANKWYWDDKHFYEPVYRIMNEDLLALMEALPPDYQRLDRSILLEETN